MLREQQLEAACHRRLDTGQIQNEKRQIKDELQNKVIEVTKIKEKSALLHSTEYCVGTNGGVRCQLCRGSFSGI